MARFYISSTYNDLQDYRKALYDMLRKLCHDAVAMEDYVAQDQRPLDKCLEMAPDYFQDRHLSYLLGET